MNKSFCLLSVLIGLFLSSSITWAGFGLGVLAGYRSNEVTSDNTLITYKSTPGYQAGALINYSFADTVGLRSGLIYSTRDVEGTIALLGNATLKVKLTSLDIPLDLFVKIPGIGLYAFGGIKYGIKSSSSSELSTGVPFTVDIASSNTMLDFGAGYAFNFSAITLALEAEYESGITDVDNSASTSIKTKALMGNLVLMSNF